MNEWIRLLIHLFNKHLLYIMFQIHMCEIQKYVIILVAEYPCHQVKSLF